MKIRKKGNATLIKRDWIKQIVNEFDVGCRLRFPALASYNHEYEYEIDFIFKYLSLNHSPTDSELSDVIVNAFEKRFYNNPKNFDSMEMARQILKISNKVLCPVCHESYFEDRYECFDFCGSSTCSWEAEGWVYNDLEDEDSPNLLSVVEDQLYRILFHDPNTRPGLEAAREHYKEIDNVDYNNDTWEEFIGRLHVFVRDMLGVYYDAYAYLDSGLSRESYIQTTFDKMRNYESY